jgi:hypothetical protein
MYLIKEVSISTLLNRFDRRTEMFSIKFIGNLILIMDFFLIKLFKILIHLNLHFIYLFFKAIMQRFKPIGLIRGNWHLHKIFFSVLKIVAISLGV